MKFFACVLFMAFAFAAEAQNLSKEEEGRKEVGACYVSGSGNIYEAAQALTALQDLFWANWRDSTTWTDEEWKSFLTEWQRTVCGLVQLEVLVAYARRYACFDVEQAYGVTNSSARSVFLRAYNRSIAALKPSGLWVSNDRDFPQPGTDAFNTACNSYFNPTSDAAADARIAPMLGLGPRKN